MEKPGLNASAIAKIRQEILTKPSVKTVTAILVAEDEPELFVVPVPIRRNAGTSSIPALDCSIEEWIPFDNDNLWDTPLNHCRHVSPNELDLRAGLKNLYFYVFWTPQHQDSDEFPTENYYISTLVKPLVRIGIKQEWLGPVLVIGANEASELVPLSETHYGAVNRVLTRQVLFFSKLTLEQAGPNYTSPFSVFTRLLCKPDESRENPGTPDSDWYPQDS